MRTRAATLLLVLGSGLLVGCCRAARGKEAHEWAHEAWYGGHPGAHAREWWCEALHPTRRVDQSDVWWREARCLPTGGLSPGH